MARFILLAILFLVVVRLVWRLVRGIFEGMGYQGAGAAQPPSVGLVRDPVCGMFVMPSKALTSGAGAETRYFCSDKCRQEYARRA
jgi:YHS domain-containing protein